MQQQTANGLDALGRPAYGTYATADRQMGHMQWADQPVGKYAVGRPPNGQYAVGRPACGAVCTGQIVNGLDAVDIMYKKVAKISK
jgi:hypothetical protein